MSTTRTRISAGAARRATLTITTRAQVEAGTFPTAKVVGGRDFVGDEYNPTNGMRNPKPDDDPLDCGGHGSHVAGTAAGNGVLANRDAFLGPYNQSFDPGQFYIGPGMAPKAKIYALKVFGCSGGTEFIGPALERAADPNGDGDFSDRLDVVNASLGAGYGIGSQAEERLTQRLVDLGTVFVAAAGNDGDQGRPFFSLAAPASYSKSFSVAASLNFQRQLLAIDVSGPDSVSGLMLAADSTLGIPLSSSGDITGTLVAATPNTACGGITNPDAVKDQVALVDRGGCTFIEKFQRASEAGARAIVVVDNRAELPFAMGGDGRVALPGVMVREADGGRLRKAVDEGITIKMSATLRFPVPVGPDYIAGFSSRGPGPNDGAFKPEITAPGQGVRSARVGTGNGRQTQSGTSMASPVVAGAAALVRQAHPSMTPLEIKAVIMNTAATVTDIDEQPFPASLSGAGRVDVARAIEAQTTARVDSTSGDVGISLGVIHATESESVERTVLVKNHGTNPVTYDVAARVLREMAGGHGVGF